MRMNFSGKNTEVFDVTNMKGEVTEIFLERETVGGMFIIPKELVAEMAEHNDWHQLRVYLMDMGESIGIQARTYIWKERLGTEKLEVPATWWDHFKQDHFPEWLLKRYPVRYIEYSYRFDLLYPGIAVDRSRHHTVIRHIS